MPETRQPQQLTLDVAPHPDIQHRDGPHYISGTLKVGGDVRVNRDLQPGDELTVSVHNADGEVVGSERLEVGPVTFKPIEDKDLGVIATERQHRAKVTGD